MGRGSGSVRSTRFGGRVSTLYEISKGRPLSGLEDAELARILWRGAAGRNVANTAASLLLLRGSYTRSEIRSMMNIGGYFKQVKGK